MYVCSQFLFTFLTFAFDDRIPVLMFAWGLVTMAHALITDKGGYLTGRLSVLSSL